MDAKSHQPVTEWGAEGFIIASMVETLVNVLGVMYNPHYQEVLGSDGKA
jgi:hypothetical protein